MHQAEQAMREMPRYQCHKQVWALKIQDIIGNVIMPADDGFGPFDVSDEYMQKHKPQAGGYYVEYGDGYKSFSPAEAFESGYTDMRKGEQFRRELMNAINRNSMENGSSTPDFILASYLSDSLAAFDKAVDRRTKWAGVPKPEFKDVTPIVTGALFDLMGFLTTRPERIVLSGSDEAGPAVEALKAFFQLRGIDDAGDPLIPEWKLHCKRRPDVLQNLIDSARVSENPRIEGSRNTLT